MNEQQFEWCRKLHFRKGCFSLLLSLRLSPVAVGFFFIRSSQRKSCQNFSSPLLFPTMLFLRPVITMIAVSFFNPQRLSCERVGLWCRFSIESSCTHFFFTHLILVFFFLVKITVNEFHQKMSKAGGIHLCGSSIGSTWVLTGWSDDMIKGEGCSVDSSSSASIFGWFKSDTPAEAEQTWKLILKKNRWELFFELCSYVALVRLLFMNIIISEDVIIQ